MATKKCNHKWYATNGRNSKTGRATWKCNVCGKRSNTRPADLGR